MRKVFVSAAVCLLLMTASASASVEQDTELHRVLGGLYSLSCAVSLSGESQPGVNQLRRYFSDVPNDWYSTVQVAREKGTLWVGVSVGKYSTARKFLREHAAELGIYESPEGYEWLGGDFAWIKVSSLKAARGTGADSGTVFLSADGDSWWMASPSFTVQAAKNIISKFGVKRAPELHRPSGLRDNLYESVKPADVQKPKDMHVGRKRSGFDSFDIEVGKDVIFNPVPNRRRH